ncbi:DUF3349 domain-containing protein [Janthinobacterium sp. Ant5-2-1]|uniref:DUF3349 domain-containing protein n=1 Tax=Janthinobacterium sp. Ant5-2-1 TaxID=1755239 RepID=UPI001F38F5CC|nr:DUF3349 domain-containing protein [Janthinobacterium sp. Ant5-2-1]
MSDTLPPTLSGTARMLRSAYPAGIPGSAYFPVLAVLYEHFSDRNLAELMAAVMGKDAAVVLNDIYACASSKPASAAIAAAKRLLEQHGLQAICAED